MRKVKQEIINCLVCDRNIKRTSNYQKYCKECAIIKSDECKRLEYNNRCKLKDKNKICQICKKHFNATNLKVKFCSENCFNLHMKKYMENYRIKYANTINGRIHLRIGSERRRAFKLNIIEKFTYNEWLQKLHSTNGFCQKCGKDVGIMGLSIDHIYPISKAYQEYLETGTKRIYTIEDVQPLCLTCNIVKSDRIENEKETK